VILDYFGDPDRGTCGNCDRCVSAARVDGPAANAATAGLTPADQAALLCGIRVILSGITRMHGRFGKTLVAQMLAGSQNKRITQWKLQRLSTYGMLSSMKQSQLTRVMDKLIDHGLVEQREIDQRRPTVEITELGRAVMHLKTPLPASFELGTGLARSLAAAARHLESGDVSAAESEPSLRPRQAAEPAGETHHGESDDASSGPGVAAVSPAARGDAMAAAEPAAASSSWQRDGGTPANSAANLPTGGGLAIGLDDLVSPEEKLTKEIVGRLKRWRQRTSAA
jgi:ATP-dependent DNA helicase RecQ